MHDGEGHSNAFGEGCGDAAQYLLVMFKSGNANSIGLRDELLQQLDPQVPGDQNSWNCDTLGECAANAAHIAYIELFFHTNQAAVDWFTGPADDPEATGGMDASPFVGLALDEHLGYPRSAEVRSESPLDRYPGFGRSSDATLRDETIAYWEAFEREQHISRCMSDAGFEYSPAVAFPTRDMLEIAENLGIEGAGASSDGASPAERNRAYATRLSNDERERYTQTLLGESAAALAEADRTGIVPDGRAQDFATGGCFGEAQAAISSIWDAQRNLSGDLDALRREIAVSDEMQEARVAYGECAASTGAVTASGPWDLEERIADGGSQSEASSIAYEECASTWATGYERAANAAAGRFVEAHAQELGDVARRYEGVMDQITQDNHLLTYLATQATST